MIAQLFIAQLRLPWIYQRHGPTRLLRFFAPFSCLQEQQSTLFVFATQGKSTSTISTNIELHVANSGQVNQELSNAYTLEGSFCNSDSYFVKKLMQKC